MKFSSTRYHKGFTLIELLTTIAIVSILAMIAISHFSSYRVRASNAAALSDIQNFKVTMASIYAEKQCYVW